MKQICFFVAMLCVQKGFTQELKLRRNNLNQVEYSEVIKTDSLSATQLYLNSNSFVKTAFQNVRTLAILKDEKLKTIATKGSIPVSVEVTKGDSVNAKT